MYGNNESRFRGWQASAFFIALSVLIAWGGMGPQQREKQTLVKEYSDSHYSVGSVAERGPCTVERRTQPLSCVEFVSRFLGRTPIVFPTTGNDMARSAYAKERLLREQGDLVVSLSTANTYTGREWKKATLRDYVQQQEQSAGWRSDHQNGGDVFYLFGGTHGDGWTQLLNAYHAPYLPSESILSINESEVFGVDVCSLLAAEREGSRASVVDEGLAALGLPARHLTKTFGLAGNGTGVPFHFHGPGFNEVLHGAKRWYLSPPLAEPQFNPNRTTLAWTREVLPGLPPDDRPLVCDIHSGEAIYFPSGWYHATLNLEPYTVWVATFA